ncbi:hypothetical protein [Clostridium tepidiprofundi]|uniref:hypothetical protein n=1 Tax=Clostridium tepidiprofundi TaxID=420412 RepID=UPI00128F3F86|nr:hypothetical protein [Clostridium tepidiprofundi]
MVFYEEADNNVLKIVKSYIKFGERIRVSKSIKLGNKLYREIIINKKFFNKLSNEAVGYLYIDENNNIVDDENIKKEIAKISYFAEMFLDDSNPNSLKSALLSDEDMQKDRNTYKEALEALEGLIKDGLDEGEKIIHILENMPDLRMKNDEKLREVIYIASEFIDENNYFDDKICKELRSKYVDAMLVNFEKVKLVASGARYYDNIKKSAEKKRKRLSVRFNSKVTIPIFRLDYILSYFKRIIRTYECILKMSNSEYIKRMSTIERENINKKIELIR